MKPSLTDRALPEQLPEWGVLVLESHHSPKFVMEWRTHPFVKIVYVLSGRGTFFLGKKEYSFVAGDVIVVPPGTRNRIVDDPVCAASLYICCVARGALQFDLSLIKRLPCRVLPRESGFANRVESAVRRMVYTQQSRTLTRPISMVIDALKLIQIISEKLSEAQEMGKGTTDYRRIVQQYVDSLPNRFFEETSIDAAAHQLNIPRRTFTKVFAELAGDTWLRHLRRLAIQHAQHRLHSTDIPITSIAFECGFNDLSTFYRQFQRYSRMSPGEYRATAGSINRTD